MKILINNQRVLPLNKQAHTLLNSEHSSEFSKALCVEHNAKVINVPYLDFDCIKHLTLEDLIEVDGVYTFTENIDNKCTLLKLRQQRELECFSVINRGKLWYDTLTPEQVTELDTWYQAWRDVTVTLVVPTKPSWLDV